MTPELDADGLRGALEAAGWRCTPQRLAVYELLWTDDVPPKVAINEALEVAKKFSTQESSRFLNGILDRIHKELRPAG